MAEKVLLTEKGIQELEQRLDYLKTVKRAEIKERIKVAREFGDLSENAEYDAAKNEQSLIEGEILEIEAKLKSAEIITLNSKKDVVSVGSRVCFTDLSDGKVYEFEIVGTTEADLKAGRISNESPLGKAMLGKKVGDTVTVTVNNYSYPVTVRKLVKGEDDPDLPISKY